MIKKIALTLVVVGIASAIIFFIVTKEISTGKSGAAKDKMESANTANKPKLVRASATPVDKSGRQLQPSPASDASIPQLSAKDIIDKLRESFNKQIKRGQANVNRNECIGQLKALGDKAIPEIRAVLFNGSESRGLKSALLQVLAGIKSDKVMDTLIDLADTKTMENNIRRYAVNILTRNAPEKTYDVVKNILENEPNFPQRYSLVKALGDSKDERALPLLYNIVETDANKSAKYIAISNGLAAFATNPMVREKLKGYATSNADPAIRRNSIIALSRHKDDQTKMFLEGILNTEKDARVIATAKQILSRW